MKKTRVTVYVLVIFIIILVFTACGGGSGPSIIGTTISDTEAVQLDKDDLDIGYSGADSIASVTANLTLAASGANGTTITWGSDSPGVIVTDGTVTRPAYGSGDAAVMLTATIDKNGTTDTKVFNLTVIKEYPSTDAEVVDADKAVLEITYSGSDSAGYVTQNVVLPTSGSYGSSITWGSDSTSVIATNGTVTRPAEGSGNAVVTLTATIDKNGTTDTKTLNLIVIESGPDLKILSLTLSMLPRHFTGLMVQFFGTRCNEF